MRAIRPVLGAALLAAAVLLAPAPASADAVDDLRARLLDAQNALLDAAAAVAADDAAAAAADLGNALAALAAAQGHLSDEALQAALGKAFKGVQKAVGGLPPKVQKARIVVENGKLTAKAKINKLKATAKSALVAGLKLGKPVFGEVVPGTGRFSRSAGFHKPGDRVEFQVYGPDGLPCTETPVVSVQNAPFSQAIDLDSVLVGEDGRISMTMGTGRGGGSVSVTACERTSTMLLYNYGPAPIPGLPDGFPSNLPTGTYRMTYSATGEVVIPPTEIGVFPLVDMKSFAKTLVAAFESAAAATNPGPNCSQKVSYTPFDGASFSVSYTATCTSEDVTVWETTTFTLTKL